MTTLYFIRHGETDYNRRGIVQGSGVDSTLNEKGQLQALAFFDRYHQTKFDAVYASELRRTHQTLAPWVEDGYRFERHRGLNELNWGVHEGKSPTPEQRANFMHVLRRWVDNDWDAKVKQGESPREAWERARPFFEGVLDRHPGEQLLVCSHGRQLRIIIGALIGLELSEMEHYKHHNTGLSIIELETIGQGRLRSHNDISHLPSDLLEAK